VVVVVVYCPKFYQPSASLSNTIKTHTIMAVAVSFYIKAYSLNNGFQSIYMSMDTAMPSICFLHKQINGSLKN